MMTVIARLRRAYELGRLRSAARVAPWSLLLATLWLLGGNPPGITLGVASLLAIVTTALRFRGLAFGAGVWPGLFAGAV